VSRTVLIVDDHDGFRAGARALLEADGFEVVGEAADGETALEAVFRLRPDVVLLDVQLPGLDGFAVAERLAAERDPPAVVLISSRAADAYRRQLATSPARGFIAKGELSGECLAGLLV
jgi:DNA-binding NarL/FixJ family response regulator